MVHASSSLNSSSRRLARPGRRIGLTKKSLKTLNAVTCVFTFIFSYGVIVYFLVDL